MRFYFAFFFYFQNGSGLRQMLEKGRRLREDNRDRSEMLAI